MSRKLFPVQEDLWSDEELFMDSPTTCATLPQNFCFGNLPIRLLYASKHTDNEVKHGKDVLCEFMKKKTRFLQLYRSNLKLVESKNYFDVFNKLQQQIESIRTNECYIKVPSDVPHFMKFIKEQPDQDFSGDYNWYYTGGCLQHFTVNKKSYIAYVDGKKTDNLCVAPLKLSTQWNLNTSKVKNVVTPEDEPIFQVLAGCKNLIGVRKKHVCVVYNYNGSEITECTSTRSDIPFVSFSLSSVHQELCTINAGQMLSFWDIQRKKIPLVVYFPSDNSKYDKWHHLWYSSDPSVVSIATRKSLKWVDRRSNDIQRSVALDKFRSKETEEISVHFPSILNSYVTYVATNANLYTLDTRSLGSVIHRWSHRMKSSPLYYSVIPVDERSEIACIANHCPGKTVLAFNSISNSYPLVEISPRTDHLASTQASGMCLDPSIQPRLKSSLMGLAGVYSSASLNAELLSQTAAMDIYSQPLFNNFTDANSCSLNGLATSREVLYAAERWNMAKLYEQLSKKDLNLSVETPKMNKKKKQKQAWQITVSEMTEYKDALSSIILAHWDIDVCDKPGISREQKVNEWLYSNSFDGHFSSSQDVPPSWKN